VVVGRPGRTRRAPAGRPDEHTARPARAVVWHDLECGAYTADLLLWRELARAASGPVLDVGAGTGRVALDLATHGHEVTALDLDAKLLAAMRERVAALGGGAIETVCADARVFALERQDFALCIAPMQTLQLFGGSSGRLAFMQRARAHLRAGGVLACAIVTEIEPFDCAAGDLGPSPEVTRLAGLEYISHVTCVRVRERSVRIERERSVTARTPALTSRTAPEHSAASAPDIERDTVELDRVSVDELQREGRTVGLRPAGTREIPETGEHAGCVAVLFDA